MAQRKYLLVEGVMGPDGHGIPVSDPWNPIASPARFLGFKFKGGEPNPRALSSMAFYEVARQVVIDHPSIQKAARNGHIRILGKCAAWDADDAAKQLMPKAPAPAPEKIKAPKGGDA